MITQEYEQYFDYFKIHFYLFIILFLPYEKLKSKNKQTNRQTNKQKTLKTKQNMEWTWTVPFISLYQFLGNHVKTESCIFKSKDCEFGPGCFHRPLLK